MGVREGKLGERRRFNRLFPIGIVPNVLKKLRAEIATTFGPKMVAISARNTKVYKLCKAIFSAFYNISQPNFAILLILVCSF
jgi:hypothetical protein